MKRATKQQREAAAVWLPTKKLKPWDQNPRHNEAAVGKVLESIERFGFGAPIVAREADLRIIAGHTRWLAAQRLGMEEVPVRLLPLSDVDARTLALADNKLGELAEWDDGRLATVLRELLAEDVSPTAAGFSDAEYEKLLAELIETAPADVEEDETPEPPKDPKSKPGQLYQLGPHRLLCGDSTQIDDVEKLLDGTKADMLFTDPPYGIAYESRRKEGGKNRFAKIENDDLRPDALYKFLFDCLTNAATALKPGAAVYVCHADQKPGLRPAFERALADSSFHLGGCIIWVKQAASMGWQDYRSKYEPILYGWSAGGAHQKVTDRAECNVWEIDRDGQSHYEHPTQKPVELPSRAIRNSTRKGETVLDLFGGSGSTLIAAAKTGRRAALVEKDPGYCDVIRERWERFARKAGIRNGR